MRTHSAVFVKLDKAGKFVTAWGERGNRRMQVLDENGRFVDQWPFNNPSSVNVAYTNGDGAIWAFEAPTAKVVKYDREGHPVPRS